MVEVSNFYIKLAFFLKFQPDSTIPVYRIFLSGNPVPYFLRVRKESSCSCQKEFRKYVFCTNFSIICTKRIVKTLRRFPSAFSSLAIQFCELLDTIHQCLTIHSGIIYCKVTRKLISVFPESEIAVNRPRYNRVPLRVKFAGQVTVLFGFRN